MANKKANPLPAIVLLHGWTTDPGVTAKWQPFIKLLEKVGFKVHFWPLPGLAVPPKKALTLQKYVDWLAKKTAQLDSFVLLGHSFGGQLATRFTRLHPEKVSQLILVDSSGIIDHSLPKVLKRRLFKTMAKVGKKITKSAVLRKLLYQIAREKDYYHASPTQRATMQNILMDEVRDDLPTIKAKTLVIWGKNDKMTPLQLGEEFSKTLPKSEFVIIPKARHTPIYTHPEVVLDAISTFLKV